jgi:hypothetical protein
MTAIEVNVGPQGSLPDIAAFDKAFKPTAELLVGGR